MPILLVVQPMAILCRVSYHHMVAVFSRGWTWCCYSNKAGDHVNSNRPWFVFRLIGTDRDILMSSASSSFCLADSGYKTANFPT